MSDEPSSAPIRTLLVADDEHFSQEIALPLLQAGYALATTQVPDEALRYIATKPWDAVLIGANTIETNLAFVSLLHQQQPDLALIMVSTPQPAPTIQHGFALGVYDWLFKPIALPLVQAALQRAAERGRLLTTASRADRSPYPAQVRHDINNQLAGIVGLVQLHQIDATLPAELLSDLDVIVESVRQIRELLQRTAS